MGKGLGLVKRGDCGIGWLGWEDVRGSTGHEYVAAFEIVGHVCKGRCGDGCCFVYASEFARVS